MKPGIQLTLLALLLVGLFSCTRGDQTMPDEVIASVHGQQLTISTALTEIPPSALATDSLHALQTYIDRWIADQLLVREARRLQLQQNQQLRDRLRRMEEQLLKSVLQETILSNRSDELQVTREEAQNYFQEHKDKFVLDERFVRFRHLTTETRGQIEAGRRALLGGTDWVDVANQYSIQPDLQIRASTQYWPISMAASDIPLLNRYLNVIGITEISPIHQDGGRFHFVQLLEVRNAGDHPDFEWLLPRIEEWLQLEKSRRLISSYERNLILEAASNNDISKRNSDELNTLLNRTDSPL
ncbi:MAG: peptidyl-prolyl cis-trans isomerase [Balneolaceae bacterium]